MLDDPKGGVTNANMTYSGTYQCGTADAVNFTNVTTSTPLVVPGIPAGVNCTVTETKPSGSLLNGSYSWGNPTYSTQSVTITDGGTATVTITNHVTQNTGTFTVLKAVTGPGGYNGSPARRFPVTYSCTLNGAAAVTGTLNTNTAGAVSSPAIPVSSICTLSETLTTNPGDFADPSYEWTGKSFSTNPVTIVAGTPVAVTVTNTYARQFGSLQINKLIDGSGYNGGTNANFTVNYVCGGLADSVTIANGESAMVNGLPAGATCTLTEVTPAENLLTDAYDWGTPTWSTDNTPVIVKDRTVERTVTNHTVAVFGSISVTKAVTGATSGLVAGTTFRVTVACAGLAPLPFDLVVGLPQSTGNLPVGTKCDVTETAPTTNDLLDSSYAWGSTPGVQHVVIANSTTPVSVTVTNTINRVRGAFTITKVVEDPDGVVASARSFTGTYSCQYLNDQAVTGSWNLQNGAIVTVDSILLGSVCEVKEDDSALTAPPSAIDPSFVWAGVPAPQSVTIASSTTKPGVTVTNVVTRLSGTLGVTKIVAGDGKVGGYVPASTFPFDYTCAPALGLPVSGSFSLADGAAWPGRSVPAGAICTVTEGANPATTGPDYNWGGVVFSGAAMSQDGRSATFTMPLAGTPVQITATNTITRTTGSIVVTKQVTGETDGLLTGTNFEIALVCSDQVARSAQVANGQAHTFTGIPANVTCTASETTPTAPLLNASFAWGTPTYSPLTAVGVDGSITVINPITRLRSPSAPTIVKSVVGGPSVAADGSTTLKYQLVVTNPNTVDATTYDLADTLGFAAGVTVLSATLTTTPAGVTVNAGWNGSSSAAIATGVALPAASTHTYEVTVVAVVPTTLDASLRACAGTAGSGFFNSATLTALGANTAVSACANIAPEQESGAPIPTTTAPTAPPTTTAVRSAAPLPATGGDLNRLLLAAAVPLALGLLMLALRRRQRPA